MLNEVEEAPIHYSFVCISQNISIDLLLKWFKQVSLVDEFIFIDSLEISTHFYFRRLLLREGE